MASKLKLTELLYPTSTTPAITINADDTVTFGASTTTITNLSATSITDSGNLNFTGTGNRITGDFSNATVANRVAIQTSTTNGNTAFFYLPNGTSQTANAQFHNASDPTNAANMLVGVTSSDATLRSGITGTGTYLPMTFYTGGSERVRVDTSGNVGIGIASPGFNRLNVSAAAGTYAATFYANTGAGVTTGLNSYGLSVGGNVSGGSAEVNLIYGSAGGGLAFNSFNGTTITERMRLDQSGNLGLGVTPSAWRSSDRKNLQIVGGAVSAGEAFTVLYANAYLDTSAVSRYVYTGAASSYAQSSVGHAWSVAPSGTAGNAISFTQAMTLDASGRQLIGVASNTAYETNTKSLLYTSGTGQVFNLLQLTNAGTPAEGNIVGIGFAAGESTQYGVKGSIGFVRTDIYGRGALTFYTNNTAGSESVSTANERARIDSAGNLLVATTSAIRSGKLTVNGNLYASTIMLGSASTNLYIYEGSTNNLTFRAGGNGTEKYWGMDSNGRFTSSNGPVAGAGAYIDLSDIGSKENITSVPYGLAEILLLKPSMFSFIGNTTKELGFIAQEVQEVIPEAVTQFDEERLGLQTSSLISVVVKAIQELKAEFDAYKLSHP